MADIDKILPVPDQKEGSEKNFESFLNTTSEIEAVELYTEAKARLLDVNNWEKISGKLSATFILTDHRGNEVAGNAKENYYFKIDVPGPGSAAGKGYDWVKVEKIEEKKVNAQEEFIIMTVRPTDNPATKEDNVAHFFSDKATSNFVVKREGCKVTAAVYGRNEVPNTETNNIIDKARNAIVGLGALVGFSNPQWKSLVDGLLKAEKVA